MRTAPFQKRKRRRGGPDLRYRPVLYLTRILTWADAYHARTGSWPKAVSGSIPEAPGDTWHRIDKALIDGLRGLPGGSSLARLLAERRGVRNRKALPPYTQEQILSWAESHSRRTGDWPSCHAGPIPEAPGETWLAVADALTLGRRGLPGGSSLAQLLEQQRGVRNIANLPDLTVKQVLTWADAYHNRTGAWPTQTSGPVEEAPEETWQALDSALRYGGRRFRGGSSLARIFDLYRGVRNQAKLPPFKEDTIVRWARAHHRRTDRWPCYTSGRVVGVPGETWRAIDSALNKGLRGLPGGSSLAKLLAARGCKRNPLSLPRLTYTRILHWADVHHEETGEWPKNVSGTIRHTHDEKWENVDRALRGGHRGLPGGSSLAELLATRRGVRNQSDLKPYTCEEILAWADAHHERTGQWPRLWSGVIPEAPGESWCHVDQALRSDHRGLPEGSSLPRLLEERRGVPNKQHRPRLRLRQVLDWARAYRARTRKWPSGVSGVVAEAPLESWSKIDAALRNGLRAYRAGPPCLGSCVRMTVGGEEGE
jgi:hypothetical protein